MTESEIADRLERLERDNRRLKGFALGVLVLAAALGGIYAKQPAPNRILAHEFDVTDSSGKVRVILGVDPTGEGLALLGADGEVGAEMTLYPSGNKLIALNDAQDQPRVAMWVDSGEPQISLRDARGFSMDLGSTGTVSARTGETQQTSAASIVMFGNDKDHRVIWQAPTSR